MLVEHIYLKLCGYVGLQLTASSSRKRFAALFCEILTSVRKGKALAAAKNSRTDGELLLDLLRVVCSELAWDL